MKLNLRLHSHAVFSDDAFLTDRARGLRRFVGIVTKHPVYMDDIFVQAFLYDQLVRASGEMRVALEGRGLRSLVGLRVMRGSSRRIVV